MVRLVSLTKNTCQRTDTLRLLLHRHKLVFMLMKVHKINCILFHFEIPIKTRKRLPNLSRVCHNKDAVLDIILTSVAYLLIFHTNTWASNEVNYRFGMDRNYLQKKI